MRRKGQVLLAILALPALLLAYSEEDWRAYSRTKVELVDTFSLPFQAAGPFVLLGDKLVFLSKGSDSLISLDTATRAVVDRAKIASAWNMDISAMTAHDGKLYLMSRATRAIYRYEPDHEGGGPKLLLDLGKVRFDGEPMLSTFAYDGEYVYVVVLHGFNTAVVRIQPGTGRSGFFASAVGRPAALCADAGAVYYMTHQSVPTPSPILQKYACRLVAGQAEATGLLEIQLPCTRSSALVVRANFVATLCAPATKVTRLVLK